MRTDYNWRRFTKRIPVNASVKTVYRAWTSQQALEQWFLRLAEFTKPDGQKRLPEEQVEGGDAYKWLWYGYDDHTAELQQIIEANGRDTLSFVFSGGCIVTVLVKEEAGETICELSQQMPMEDESRQRSFFIECGLGWTFYLANLKSVLEGGLDLRNKNEHLKEVVSS